MFFKIFRKLFNGRGEKVEYVLLIIEIYWKVVQAIKKILLESSKCDFEEISNKYYRISPIYFQLNRGENGK
jgi:hypothetical protein